MRSANDSLGVLSALALSLATPTMALADQLAPAALSEPLEVLASRAATSADHLDVARRYRARAEVLETRAAEHAQEAARLRRRGPEALQAKWGHALPDLARRADEAALEAHRAASQARELSSRHLHLAVEAGLAQSPR